MENNQKPEWFELADNDQPVSRPLKKKSAPMRSLTFIVAGILVIPMGAGVALLTHEAQPVSGAETLNLTQDSPAATSPAQIQPNGAITMPTVSRDDDEDEDDDDRAPIFSSASISPTVLAPIAPTATSSNSKAPAVKAPAAITPPGSTSNDLILPPTKKAGHDDDDDEEEEEEDDDDDDDEDDD